MRARACWFSLGQYAWGGPRRVGRAPGVRTAPRRPRFRSRSSWIFAPSKWPQMTSGRQPVHDPAQAGAREYFARSRENMSSDRGSSVRAWHLMAHEGCTFARPSSKITRMSSPGFSLLSALHISDEPMITDTMITCQDRLGTNVRKFVSNKRGLFLSVHGRHDCRGGWSSWRCVPSHSFLFM